MAETKTETTMEVKTEEQEEQTPATEAFETHKILSPQILPLAMTMHVNEGLRRYSVHVLGLEMEMIAWSP